MSEHREPGARESTTRREFMRSFARRTLSLPVLTLGACSRSEEPRANGSARASLESELSILTRADPFARSVIEAFEREHGVRVQIVSCASMDELESKLLAKEPAHDLCLIDCVSAARLVASGMLRTIDGERVPNRSHLDPRFRKRPFDRSDTFTIPLRVRISGIAYRVDKLEVPPDGYSIFHDVRYRRKMVMLDDSREVLGAMLKLRGASLNSRDANQLESARQDAILAQKQLRGFQSDGAAEALLRGDIWVAQLTRGEANRARAQSNAIDWALPKSGAAAWIDSLAISARAEHPNAAHAFLDYVLRGDVAAELARADGHETVNLEARRRLGSALPELSEEQFDSLEIPLDLDRDQVIWDHMWDEIQSIPR